MNDVDYYDVQAMIREARSEIRGEIDKAVREATQRLWLDVSAEINELHDLIRETREATPEKFA